jgi:hypothetical protein
MPMLAPHPGHREAAPAIRASATVATHYSINLTSADTEILGAILTRGLTLLGLSARTPAEVDIDVIGLTHPTALSRRGRSC